MHKVIPDMSTAMLVFTYMFICLIVIIAVTIGLSFWEMVIVPMIRLKKRKRK